MYNKISTNPFLTDFYQLTMSYAYLMTGIANQTTCFESFVRSIKKEVAKENDFYVFKGKEEIDYFMARTKAFFENESNYKAIWKTVKTKLDPSINTKKAKKKFFKAVKYFIKDTDFKYTVLENGTKVFPLMPVFQFKGPKLIGQMIETPVTNIINGQTGYASLLNSKEVEEKVIEAITNIMGFNIKEDSENIGYEEIVNLEAITNYSKDLVKRADEYRQATTKPIAEAGFRRAANFELAYIASEIALKMAWNFTSNTSLIFGENGSNIVIDKEKLGQITGTMAHAFVMSFKKESKAFKVWNKLFPNSIMLIDTYDCVKAVKKLIKLNIKPRAVRIDSDPLEELVFAVRKELDKAGWNDVKIFISGDITPEILKDFEERNVPYDMSMAGTKYVNIGLMKQINCGFVYKIVEFDNNGEIIYPVKKAVGKGNYPGLKKCVFNEDTNEVEMFIGEETFGFENTNKINGNTKIIFKG